MHDPLTRDRQVCPPCNGNCLQGRECNAAYEEIELSTEPWAIRLIAFGIALFFALVGYLLTH
jgi:hypothetical protein